MALGDRRRYKAVATTFHSLLPRVDARIDSLTGDGFPREAVALTIEDDAWQQLIWLESGSWRSAQVRNMGLIQPEWHRGPVHSGPPKTELPARWAMGLIYTALLDELKHDDILGGAPWEMESRAVNQRLADELRTLLLT
ncbi:hypothetical protein [Agromyces sp. Root81]|uniref:hypothetical protein n=1 Tax=Agromyces sp. Root81 TaxID=1736601 RepID=UPI000B070FB8|nr:hypothetical protein [Agromyces sp. Root81]